MKKKVIVVLCALSMLFVLCAFSMGNNKVTLVGDDGDQFQISYDSVIIQGGTVSFYMDMGDVNRDVQIGREPLVYLNAECQNELELFEVEEESGRLRYTYKCNDSTAKDIYIKAPVIYKQKKCKPVIVQLKEGTTVYQGDGAPWFRIEECDIVEKDRVRVLATPLSDDLPVLLHLNCNDSEFGCITFLEHSNDQTTTYQMQYLFLIPEGSESVLEGIGASEIEITDYLERLAEKDGTDVTHIKVH